MLAYRGITPEQTRNSHRKLYRLVLFQKRVLYGSPNATLLWIKLNYVNSHGWTISLTGFTLELRIFRL